MTSKEKGMCRATTKLSLRFGEVEERILDYDIHPNARFEYEVKNGYYGKVVYLAHRNVKFTLPEWRFNMHFMRV